MTDTSAPADSNAPHGEGEPEPEVPREPLGRLFLRFLRFGSLAWGGPVAQIAMIQKELVEDDRWISRERFNRTLAIYQVLPGPEAHELCVYFGMRSRGRIGAMIAGLGFMLPGLLLMLALSWLYLTVGLATPALATVFAGFQAAVVAIVVRAVHRIGSHALRDTWLLAIAACAFASHLAGMHFAPTLLAAGVAYVLTGRSGRGLAVAMLLSLVLGAGLLRVANPPVPPPAIVQVEAAGHAASAPELFVSGLKAGLLTFGGAYTVIPFLERDAVQVGRWMTAPQFLDGLALGGILPAPLVIFATHIGFVAGGLAGALAMTAGIFLPAFSFTILGHEALERLIAYPGVHRFLDGVTAGVVGLIAATSIELFLVGVTGIVALVIFVLALVAAFLWKAKGAVAGIVLGAGALGWILTRLFELGASG